MTIQQLISKANKHYPDSFLEEFFDFETGLPKDGNGDTLAKFIVMELCETFEADASDENQIDEADRVMTSAISDIEAVRRGLKS